METYDKLASFYDRRHDNPWTMHMRRAEKPFLKSMHGRILDVGCGTGYHLKLFPGAIGVDCSEGMLKEARKYGNAVKANAERLPFADGSFDSALCMFTVLNQCNANAAIREMARVLKPGGMCIVSVASVYDHGWSFFQRLRTKNAKKDKLFTVLDQKIRLRLFAMDEIESMFNEHGLSVKRSRGIFILTTPRWGDVRPLGLTQRLALSAERLFPKKYGIIYIFALEKSS